GEEGDFVFAQGAAEDVGAAGGQAGEGFADLEDVFFIDDQAVGAAQARFERWMGIANGAEALVAAGEFHFLAFVGGAGADDGDDGDEGVNVVDVAHFAEGDHGGAFDVVDGAGLAGGDELPDL